MTSNTHKEWVLPSLITLMIWGIWAVLPKLALQTLPPVSVLFYEGVGNLLIAVPLFVFVLKGRLKVDRDAILFSAGWGVAVVMAVFFFLLALKKGPMPVIVTLTALYPLGGMILARVFLHERMNCRQWAALLMALGAIVLLAG